MAEENVKGAWLDFAIRNKRMGVYILLLVFLGFAFYLRLDCFENTRITGWVTRDFDRAFHLVDGDYFPWVGPENNNGGRLLGPSLSILLAIPLLFKYSYASIYIFNFGLNICSGILFFWVVQKYFGLFTGALAAILLSVNVIHMDMAGFPINPTFMAAFIPFFLWFLFELILKNKTNYFPFVILVVSVCLQMHFSIVIYFIILLAAVVFFGIKIQKKQILASIIFLALCFSPYIYYKTHFYEIDVVALAAEKISNVSEPFLKKGFSLVFQVLALEDVFHRITNPSIYGFYSFPDTYSTVDYYFTKLSFYGLMVFIFFNWKRHGAGSCRAELLAVLLFYIPALVYEITNPGTGWHFWHYFIFLFPTILMKSLFLRLSFKAMPQVYPVFVILILTIILIGYLVFSSYSNILRTNQWIKTQIRFDSFYNANNLQTMIVLVKEHLKLTHRDFIERVYFSDFNGFPIGLSKLIELAGNTQSLGSIDSSGDCYFIVNEERLLPHSQGAFVWRTFGYVSDKSSNELNSLRDDDSINFNAENFIEMLLVDKSFGVRSMMVFRYRPKFNRPCYTNTQSSFAVLPETVEYLQDVYGLDKNRDNRLITKVLSSKQDYFEDSVRVFESNLVMFHPEIATPIKMKIKLEKRDGKYFFRGDWIYYSWGKKEKDLFLIKELNLRISGSNSAGEPASTVLNIIKPKNFRPYMAPRVDGSENFLWFADEELPEWFQVKKENFELAFSWDIEFPNRIQGEQYSNLIFTNTISIQE